MYGVFFDGSDESLQALTELYLTQELVQDAINFSDDDVMQLLVFDKQIGVASFDLSDLHVYVGFWLVSDSGQFFVLSDEEWKLWCREPILSKVKGLFRG